MLYSIFVTVFFLLTVIGDRGNGRQGGKGVRKAERRGGRNGGGGREEGKGRERNKEVGRK